MILDFLHSSNSFLFPIETFISWGRKKSTAKQNMLLCEVFEMLRELFNVRVVEYVRVVQWKLKNI